MNSSLDTSSRSLSIALQKSKERIKELERQIVKYKTSEREYQSAIQILSKREERLNYLIEQVPIGIMVVDENSIIKQVNPFFQNKLNKKSREMIGKRGGEGIGCCNIVLGGTCGTQSLCKECPLRNAVEKVFETNRPIMNLEVSPRLIVGGKSETLWMRLNVCPLLIEEKKYAVLIIEDTFKEKMVQNLKERFKENEEKLEELVQNNQLRNHYFAHVSHELRTPLNIILGAIQLMESTNTKDNKIQRYSMIMRQNCYRLLKLINNTIDVARIDLGFYDLKLKDSNIIEVIKETTLSTVDYAKIKGIKVSFNAHMDEIIMALDEDKIERVVLNLISNAIRHTEEKGSIQVSINQKDNHIGIIVKDTGLGISPKMQADIFKIFRQGNNAFEKQEGSGIGLYLVKSIVELHGGTISVKSEEGKGSEFIIELPIRLCCSEDIKPSGYKMNKEKLRIEFSDI